MIANPSGQTFAAKGAPDHPGFQGPETATELDTVIHVIDFGAGGIAAQVFWDEGKNATKAFNFSHIESTKVEWHEQHLMRIDHNRVGEIETLRYPLGFGQEGKAAAIRRVD